MSYSVELTESAERSLAALPVDLIVCVSNHLDRLSDDPVGLGRKAGIPFRDVGQIHQFWCDGDDARYWVTLFFHFVPGRDAVKVFDLTAQQIS
jgi:hypothetical protein